MDRLEKLIAAARQSPRNVRFSDLVAIVKGIGYVHKRTNGSHQIFFRANSTTINIQDDHGKAKPYQVRQVLDIIDGKGA